MKVAVVGTGVWGEQHARVFSRRPDTDLVGVLGRDPERTEQRAAAYGTTAAGARPRPGRLEWLVGRIPSVAARVTRCRRSGGRGISTTGRRLTATAISTAPDAEALVLGRRQR